MLDGFCPELTVDPAELGNLAETTRQAAVDFRDGWRAARESLSIPAVAFGAFADQGLLLAEVHSRAVENGDEHVNGLANRYENDVDRLYQAAFAYQQEDGEASSNIAKSAVCKVVSLWNH